MRKLVAILLLTLPLSYSLWGSTVYNDSTSRSRSIPSLKENSSEYRTFSTLTPNKQTQSFDLITTDYFVADSLQEMRDRAHSLRDDVEKAQKVLKDSGAGHFEFNDDIREWRNEVIGKNLPEVLAKPLAPDRAQPATAPAAVAATPSVATPDAAAAKVPATPSTVDIDLSAKQIFNRNLIKLLAIQK